MKQIGKGKTILLVASLISVFNTATAREDSLGSAPSGIPNSWFQVGVGAKKQSLFFGGNLFFRIADGMAMGIRAGSVGEIREPSITPWESFWDITPAIAYTPIVGSMGMFSGFAGIGIAGGVRRGQYLQREGIVVERYEEIRFQRFCATFELSGAIFLPGVRALGIVASLYTNLNTERSFTGYYIGIQIRDTR